MKFRTMIISSEGQGGKSMKFCTSENFQLIKIIMKQLLMFLIPVAESSTVESVAETDWSASGVALGTAHTS